MALQFPQAWFSVALKGYRDHPEPYRTYSPFSYESLPPLPAPVFDGSFSWLPRKQELILLTPAAIDVNETRFSYRFGLRDGQTHRAIRLLDPGLLEELRLPCDELSLPLRTLAKLPVRDATVIIVENRLNLLTLPALERAIGIEGEGKAVTRLETLKWLHHNRIVYWGDIDIDGFQILSTLRNLFPHAESVMMDRVTLEHHREYVVQGNGSPGTIRSNLTASEAEACQWCGDNDLRLEQERVPQSYADRALHTI